MASFKHHLLELKVAVLNVMLIFYLTFSPSKSVGSVSVAGKNDNSSWKQEKMVLGSRPPKCFNRCLSCRPCMAALVASPNHRNTRSSSYQGDESYYLLAWKCKCGNKFFQP
ncbi:EPIDERMAL PATTERNING FACTOR-like protein 1 [Hibiscus syriacus]|uniref:EPIDERMAL PATTERNING FACTOR-like protein 1 n=1 Tax=Hibiscus syriacus TaxID=106335 RepID=UPI00192145BA|nr:EPIDERMAL PATTERNING FACTOR-like protein 1 [Hibiscus syriacus]